MVLGVKVFKRNCLLYVINQVVVIKTGETLLITIRMIVCDQISFAIIDLTF